MAVHRTQAAADNGDRIGWVVKSDRSFTLPPDAGQIGVGERFSISVLKHQVEHEGNALFKRLNRGPLLAIKGVVAGTMCGQIVTAHRVASFLRESCDAEVAVPLRATTRSVEVSEVRRQPVPIGVHFYP